MSRPRVTAVIPAHDDEATVGTAVESILAQTDPPEEVIVVDDGSVDATPAVLAGFGDRIRVLRQANAGAAAARNAGIEAAGGEVIGFLDADDAWLPAMVERQRAEFARDPDLGLCWSSLTDCDADLVPRTAPRPYRRRRGERVFRELWETAFAIPPSTAFVRREVFRRVGGFDPALTVKQDYECWLRVTMLFPVSCLDEPLALRRVHAASLTGTGNAPRFLEAEAECFRRAARFAAAEGIPLPSPVEERILVNRRRRLRDYLAYGDAAGAAVYRDALVEAGAYAPADRLAYVRGRALLALRSALRGRSSA